MFPQINKLFKSYSNKNDLDEIDKKFEVFFDSVKQYNLSNTELENLLRPLKSGLRSNFWKDKIIQLFVVGVACAAIYNVSYLNWNASAIGRICMIEMLPFWDWKNLGHEKCLLNYWSKADTSETSTVISSKLYADDCVVCENYDGVDHILSPDYEFLYERYLIRGLPVIIQDSHSGWIGNNFTEFLLTLDDMIDSVPCEIQSNLIFGKYSNIEEMLILSKNIESAEGWFLHFQNCKFTSVKASRVIAKRPLYLSKHLHPAHSSWILMSQNYNYHTNDLKQLFVTGLVVMLQLRGDLEISLTARDPCYEICGEHRILLSEGGSLIFVSDLWDIHYRPSYAELSINFVNEIDWNP